MPRTLEEVIASLPPEDRKRVEEGAAKLAAEYDRQRAAMDNARPPRSPPQQ